jgi:hypothetical protein
MRSFALTMANARDLDDYLAQFNGTHFRAIDTTESAPTTVNVGDLNPEPKERKINRRRRRMDPDMSRWTIDERAAALVLSKLSHNDSTSLIRVQSIVSALLPQHDPWTVCRAAWGQEWAAKNPVNISRNPLVTSRKEDNS